MAQKPGDQVRDCPSLSRWGEHCPMPWGHWVQPKTNVACNWLLQIYIYIVTTTTKNTSAAVLILHVFVPHAELPRAWRGGLQHPARGARLYPLLWTWPLGLRSVRWAGVHRKATDFYVVFIFPFYSPLSCYSAAQTSSQRVLSVAVEQEACLIAFDPCYDLSRLFLGNLMHSTLWSTGL